MRVVHTSRKGFSKSGNALLVASVVLGGCNRDQSPQAAEPAAEHSTGRELLAAKGPQGAVRKKMDRHFNDAQVMRRALTAGDVKTMATVAGHLANDRWPDAPSGSWEPHLGKLRSAARRAQAANTVAEGAVALAGVGIACASCHLALGPRRQGMATSPPVGSSEPSMLSHQAAVDDLWEGLSAPSAVAWQRGARALAGDALVGSTTKDTELAAQQLRGIARQGVQASRGQYAKLMVEALSTCARCHEKHGLEVAAQGWRGTESK